MFLHGQDLSPEDKVLDKDGNPIADFMVMLYPHVTQKYLKGRYTSEVNNTLNFLCLNAGYGFKQLQA